MSAGEIQTLHINLAWHQIQNDRLSNWQEGLFMEIAAVQPFTWDLQSTCRHTR